jgi:long-chain acyl-CoA synthetase
MRSLADLVRHHGAELGMSPALNADGRVISYAELERVSTRIANGLREYRVQAGSRVAYLGRNSAEYFAVTAACSKLGAVMVPLNWRLAHPELTAILVDAEPRAIVVDDEFADAAAGFAAAPELDGHVLPIGAGGADADWYSTAGALDPGHQAEADEVAFQLYTSGTTGRPKGVMSTNAAVLDSLRILAGIAGIRRESVSLCTLPTFHVGGTSWTLAGIWAGCPTVLLRDAQPAHILDAIAVNAVTNMIVVPAVILGLLDAAGTSDARVKSLERLYYGGGPMTGPLLERALASFECELVQGFGMTELPLITALLPSSHVPGSPLLRSCGQLVPETEARIVDPVTLTDVAVNHIGELWVRSNRTMSGYWKQPGETADVLPGGWLRTGDAMHVDENGYFFLHDRIKDVIISGGENIYSAEVENALAAHPEILDCAVIGVPSAKWTETVKAIVVLNRPSQPDDEDNIIRFCREQLARYKCPTSVNIVDVIPRTPAGKIRKFELRRPYWTSPPAS